MKIKKMQKLREENNNNINNNNSNIIIDTSNTSFPNKSETAKMSIESKN